MLEKIQLWYVEAVALYGDDWPSIERFVNRKISEISQTDRVRLLGEFSAMQTNHTGRAH